MTDSTESEKTHLKSLVGRLKNNMCNISILSDPDLELLANMDPNMVADVTGKDFVEQLKEASGRSAGRLTSDGIIFSPSLVSLKQNIILFFLSILFANHPIYFYPCVLLV